MTTPTTSTLTSKTASTAELIFAALEHLDAQHAETLYGQGWYSPQEIIHEMGRMTGETYKRPRISMTLMRMRDAGMLRCHQQMQQRPTRVIVNTYALPTEADTLDAMRAEFAASQEAVSERMATVAATSTRTTRLKRTTGAGSSRQRHGMRLTPRMRVPETEWVRGHEHAEALGKNMTEYVNAALRDYNERMDQQREEVSQEFTAAKHALIGRYGMPEMPHEYATA